MKTYRILLVSQGTNGAFDNIHEVIELDIDAAGKNVFDIVDEIRARQEAKSEAASQ